MIDGIIHIADVPALVAFFAQHAPEKLDEDGQSITGFTRTPTVVNGTAALTYVRVTPEEEAAFPAMPGVTVLARANYAGAGTADAVYGALSADPDALALYDAVYDRAPVTLPDGETYTPPERFGSMA
jgi:hypothetical protein